IRKSRNSATPASAAPGRPANFGAIVSHSRCNAENCFSEKKRRAPPATASAPVSASGGFSLATLDCPAAGTGDAASAGSAAIDCKILRRFMFVKLSRRELHFTMDQAQLRIMLEQVRDGGLDIDGALDRLRHLPFEDLGFAKLDHHRALRHGMPEVIFGRG